MKAAVNPAINESKLKDVGFPLELVPDQFISQLSSTVMDNPITIPTSSKIEYKWDQFDLDQWNKQSRTTRQGKTENPYDIKQGLDRVEPDLELKFKIERFVNFVIEAINKKKSLGEVLTKKDYENIGKDSYFVVKHITFAPVIIIPMHRPTLRP